LWKIYLTETRSIYFSLKFDFTLNVETSNERSSLTHDGNDRVSLISAMDKPIKCSHSYIQFNLDYKEKKQCLHFQELFSETFHVLNALQTSNDRI